MTDMQSKAAYLLVDAGVRYWEDACINGDEDFDGDLIPFRNGDRWQPVIRLADGVIEDWPAGVAASIFYKVCDDGVYHLLDEGRQVIAKWKGDYVPDSFLCIGEDGFGDYIGLEVDAHGKILGWQQPRVDPSEWEVVSS